MICPTAVLPRVGPGGARQYRWRVGVPARIRWRRPRAPSSAAWRSASIGRSCGSPLRRSDASRTRARFLPVRGMRSGGRPRTWTRAKPPRAKPPRSTRRPKSTRISRRARTRMATRTTRPTRPRRRRPRRARVWMRSCGPSPSAGHLHPTRTRLRRVRWSGTKKPPQRPATALIPLRTLRHTIRCPRSSSSLWRTCPTAAKGTAASSCNTRARMP